MKRKDLLNRFFAKGWWVLREGRSHTVLTNGKEIEVVPRHNEVQEMLARAIVKRRKL